MDKCYNNGIIALMWLVFEVSKEIVDPIDGLAFNQLPFEEKLEYLKVAFEKAVCSMYSTLKTCVEYGKAVSIDQMEEADRETQQRYQAAFPIVESVKFAVDKSTGVPDGKIIRFKRFLHDDSTPSMNYLPSVHGFHCFGCGTNGEVIDVFNLIELMSHWQGKGHLKFADQLRIACDRFIDQSGGWIVKNPFQSGGEQTKHTDFIKYTNEMNRTRHNPYLGLIDVDRDSMAISYLEGRGISATTAKRLSVMVQYPCDRSDGTSWGRGYLTFISSNGSYVRRLFIENKQLSARCPWPANKWWNKSGGQVGIFNGQVIEHCRQFAQTCFVCESAIDALTCEE